MINFAEEIGFCVSENNFNLYFVGSLKELYCRIGNNGF